MLSHRRRLVFFIDIVFIVFAYVLAFLLRFDFSWPVSSRYFLNDLLLVCLIKGIVFYFSPLYRSMWRHASVQDILEIAKTVTASSLVAGVALYLAGNPVPRSVFILDWVLLLGVTAGSRLLWRVYLERKTFSLRDKGKKTFIVGAGEAGSLLVKEIWKSAPSRFNIVGFIDDDPEKKGLMLHGIPILGNTDDLKGLMGNHQVENVIIAMPSAPKEKIRGIVRNCGKSDVKFMILPAIKEIIEGNVSAFQIKDVEIDDLLGRDQVKLDEEAISSYLSGKKILVSGAAGSIGSEICRQVAQFRPAKLLLVEAGETALFHIEKELSAAYPEIPVIPVICDVRNAERVGYLFEEFRPEVVFHAAAYKHVPMMEYNPAEAVTNNIYGTMVMADAADAHGVKNFVMISTDKAVNPTNVMGASKRVAELYVQALAAKSATKFTTVRFGNVLGSNGSVIPLFKEQIRKGGPVTVTDRNVIRYFMTIPEASQLVLQAGCLGRGGDIFVLDMGEPVRIVELAEELIRLSGLTPYEDIDIVFTGLRPGEKLFEELLIEGEGILPTVHDKIKVLSPVTVDHETLSSRIGSLRAAAASGDVGEILRLLMSIVPEYTPRYDYASEYPFSLRRVRPDIFSGKNAHHQ